MLERLKSTNPSKLKWALIVLGLNSLFVRGLVQVALNVAIITVAIWFLIALQHDRNQNPSSKDDA